MSAISKSLGLSDRILKLYQDCERADKVNAENLHKILSDNQFTTYGKIYGFSRIKSEKAYKNSVPIIEYDSVYETMEQYAENFTVYPIWNILTTSGITGKQKGFCIAAEALDRYPCLLFCLCIIRVYDGVAREMNKVEYMLLPHKTQK